MGVANVNLFYMLRAELVYLVFLMSATLLRWFIIYKGGGVNKLESMGLITTTLN